MFQMIAYQNNRKCIQIMHDRSECFVKEKSIKRSETLSNIYYLKASTFTNSNVEDWLYNTNNLDLNDYTTSRLLRVI